MSLVVLLFIWNMIPLFFSRSWWSVEKRRGLMRTRGLQQLIQPASLSPRSLTPGSSNRPTWRRLDLRVPSAALLTCRRAAAAQSARLITCPLPNSLRCQPGRVCAVHHTQWVSRETHVIQVYWDPAGEVTFTCSHLADAFIQSDLQMRRTIEAIRATREQQYTSAVTNL